MRPRAAMCHDSASGATGSRAPRTGSNCPLRPLRAVAGRSRERGEGSVARATTGLARRQCRCRTEAAPDIRSGTGSGSGLGPGNLSPASVFGRFLWHMDCPLLLLRLALWGGGQARRGCPLFHRAPAGCVEAAHAACRFGVSMGAAPARAPARRETSASCVPAAMSSGSSRSLLAETPNRTTPVLPEPDTSCASDRVDERA